MLTCMECNCKAGKHHIIFKGGKSIIVYMPINEINLCKKCHKEIHTNKDMDYRYKSLLQAKLQSLLPNKYYWLKEIKEILQMSDYMAKILARHVQADTYGYKSSDLIKYLMCGKLYH